MDPYFMLVNSGSLLYALCFLLLLLMSPCLMVCIVLYKDLLMYSVIQQKYTIQSLKKKKKRKEKKNSICPFEKNSATQINHFTHKWHLCTLYSNNTNITERSEEIKCINTTDVKKLLLKFIIICSTPIF